MIYLISFNLILLVQMLIVSVLPEFHNQKSDVSSNKIIWEENFESSGLESWQIIDDVENESSNWFVENGYLIQDRNIGDREFLLGTHIIYNDMEFSNCVIRTRIISGDDDYIGFLFNYKDKKNYYRFILSSQAAVIKFEKSVDGKFILIEEITAREWEKNDFILTVENKGSKFNIYLDDKLVFSAKDDSFDSGKIGFMCASNVCNFYDWVRVYEEYKVSPIPLKEKISFGPYMQNVLGDSAAIMWGTSLPINANLEYRKKNKSSSFIKVDSLKKLHTIKLTGLVPNTEYNYRIHLDSSTTKWYSFKSAAEKNSSFNFILYGDNQMNFLRHNEIVKNFDNHEFNFIVSCGDVVQRGERNNWNLEFFDPLKEILPYKPIYVSIGNHQLDSRNFYKYFDFPNSEHENYYSFKYGNSYFIFIDNRRSAYPDKEYYPSIEKGSKQYEWIENEFIKAQRSSWIFVVSHVPCFLDESHDLFPLNRINLVPLFKKYNVDVCFSGHVHGYFRNESDGIYYITSGGGGGNLFLKKGDKSKLPDNFRRIHNYCSIEIQKNVFDCSVFDINGNRIDQIVIDKSN